MATFTMSNQVRWIGWFLVTISIISSILLRLNVNIHPLLSLADTLIAVLVLLVARLLEPAAQRWPFHSAIARTITFGVVLLPGLSALYQRSLGWTGEAWEIVVVATIQYLALWLVTWRPETKYQWMGILLGSFMFLFCFVMADQVRMQGWLFAYALLGTWWLMSAHWARVERGFLETRSISMIPMRLGLLTLIVALSVVVAWLFAPRDWMVRSLEGFMPTSGGQLYADAAARSGVGDGELLVPAVNDTSIFGPVESEIFLESQQPSLYDVVSELYGEPKGKSKKKQERAISLAGMSDKPADEGRESQEGSREFATVRDPKGIHANNQRAELTKALMLVDARLGHHWKMGSFDSFDGSTWRSSELQTPRFQQQPSLEYHFQKPWIRVAWASKPLFGLHARVGDIRIINLRSPRLPTPNGLTHLHIDRVDRPDFFGFDSLDQHIVMEDREYIPQLTTIHLAQSQPNLHLLRFEQATEYRETHESDFASHRSNPAAVQNWMATAREWTSDASNDWQRVESIVRRLRTEFSVDRSVSPPEDCDDVVGFFLDLKRGPDYLFATTAAILLRSIGIETRFVNGFYARDEKYDPKTRHTQVDVGDMHCWVEAKFCGEWIGIEPTPGYRPPIEYRTWGQWAWQLGYDSVQLAIRHPLVIITCLLVLVMLWQVRILLLAIGWIFLCLSLSYFTTYSHRWSLRMLLGISRLHRTGKCPEETISEWLRRDWQVRFSGSSANWLPQLLAEAYEHETFAPQHLSEDWRRRHILRLRQVRTWTTKVALENVFARSQIGKFTNQIVTRWKASASQPAPTKRTIESYQVNS